MVNVIGVDAVDIIVIVVYLVFCLAVGFLATWRTQRSSVTGYFLAGKDMLWFTVGASLFSTDIGSGAMIGFAGTGAASGIAVASYEFNGLFCVLLLAWVFVPVYISSGVYTMPGYLKKRFGGQRLQVYMSVLALLISVFTKITADIFAGAVFIQQAVGWNIYVGIVTLLAITTIYTVTGGLKAVIYTDTLQTVIMVVGAFVLMGISFAEINGLSELYRQYPLAVPSPLVNGSSCGIPTDQAFHLLRPADAGDLPWPGNVFGITILSAWYFCSDQVLVQRSLAAKNMLHAKGGSILAGYLKILPLFIVIFPGMISRVLFTDQVACVDPDVCKAVCDNSAGCTNIAYPKLVVELMPVGLKGLMLAAMMAALMSSLTSVFNSSSTIFTMDIWPRLRPRATDGELLIVGRYVSQFFNSSSTIFTMDIWPRLRPRATDRELLIVGRVFVLVLVGISIVWIPVLQAAQGGQLFNYIQSVTGYLAPPVLSLYLMAILWKRTNEQGAFWGLMVGLVVGLIRMGLDFGYGSPDCGQTDTRPSVITEVHFLHFTIILFFVSLFTTWAVSLLTSPIDEKHLSRLTFWTRHSTIQRVPFDDELVNTNQEQYRTDGNQTSREFSKWRKVLYIICGYEPQSTKPEMTEEEKQKQEQHLTSIKEHPKWRWFVNINAIVLIIFCLFLWIYFS